MGSKWDARAVSRRALEEAEDPTVLEAAWLEIIRWNRARVRRERVAQYWWKRLRVTVTQRSSSDPLGRFGGGWQWALGFRFGSSTLLLDLLVLSITVALIPKRALENVTPL